MVTKQHVSVGRYEVNAVLKLVSGCLELGIEPVDPMGQELRVDSIPGEECRETNQ
jgi:hypothetical protein